MHASSIGSGQMDPGQLAARSVGSLHPPARPPPPPRGGDSQRMMRGMSGNVQQPQGHAGQHPAHQEQQQSRQSTKQPTEQPKQMKPKHGLNVKDFRHDPRSGTFSVTLPTGVTLTSKNPFELQSRVLMSAKQEIRPALADMMTEVTMQWSSCTTPSLQDVANDAVDDTRRQNYIESANLLCSVRDKIPTPKIDVLRHKCMTMEDTVKWLLDLETANPKNVVHEMGLTEKRYYHLATGKLNEEGKTKVDSLSDTQRSDLKGWFHRSDADIHKWVLGQCISPSAANQTEPHSPKPLHGVHRVCVFNLRKAYDNQSASIRKAISDHEKLTKGRRTILIFVAVLLVVVVIVIVIVVVMRNKKRAKEQALATNVSYQHSPGTNVSYTHSPDTNVTQDIPTTTTPTTNTFQSAPTKNAFVQSLMPSYSTDPIDADIDRLALELPK